MFEHWCAYRWVLHMDGFYVSNMHELGSICLCYEDWSHHIWEMYIHIWALGKGNMYVRNIGHILFGLAITYIGIGYIHMIYTTSQLRANYQ